MRRNIVIAFTAAGVAALASAGIAVNAATLSAVPSDDIGRAPTVLVPTSDDHGGQRPDDVSDDVTPAPSESPEPGDDNLPQHSGDDDGTGHDVGDDDSDSGSDDTAGSDDSDHGSDDSGHGSDDSGSGSDDSGHDSDD